jgi:hypothetical protein
MQILDYVLGNRCDMTIGATTGHHHEIAYRGFASEIDGDAVLGLHIVEACEDEAECLLGVSAPRDGVGRAT